MKLKINVSEAENVCHNLHLINLKLLDRNQTEEIRADKEVISVVMDGGGFEEKR